MSDNLFDLIEDDLNQLSDLIADSLNSHNALQQAKKISEGVVKPETIATLDLLKPNDADLKQFAYLSITSDCLLLVTEAIVADGEVDKNEMDLAYTIVEPLATNLGLHVDRYTEYVGLEREELKDFLNVFNSDSEVFGGSTKGPSVLFGGSLSAIACILTDSFDAIDSYEHINISILDGIMRIGGMDTN